MRSPQGTMALSFFILWVALSFTPSGLASENSSWAQRLGFDLELNAKLDPRKFLPTTEYYAEGLRIERGELTSSDELQEALKSENYSSKSLDQWLQPGDYSFVQPETCLHIWPDAQGPCLCLRKKKSPQKEDRLIHWVFWNADATEVTKLTETQQNENSSWTHLRDLDDLSLEPKLIAQYSEGKPLLQLQKKISEVPSFCLNSVLAIEDQQFLEHGGFSWTGLGRALVKNLKTGKMGQGGSTITQQLVKNYFLTNERSLKRKAKELVLAVLLESKYSKDEILETYLNIIYMGQSGPFQVIGFGAAARHYFGKDLNDINLSQCALLAAVLNGPGVYDPWLKPDRALSRREMVLQKMFNLKMISQKDFEEAKSIPLPNRPPPIASETAPYFVEAAADQLKKISIDLERKKVFLSLNLKEQLAAQNAVQDHLKELETSKELIKKNLSRGLSLEGLALVGDPRSGRVLAAVGGRSFKVTQYNRVAAAHRQVGSVIKPFVFLAALTDSENPRNALTVLPDELREYKIGKQKWKPENYNKKYLELVPFYVALKDSLNAPTVALSQEIGIEKTIELLRHFGVTSEIKPLPSLALGAFELFPQEVLRAYMGLSQMGWMPSLSFVDEVRDEFGQTTFKRNPEQFPGAQAAEAQATGILVSILKQTLFSGTAKSLISEKLPPGIAGKTGTTSDYKDSWFVGFSPYRVGLAWVGYDQNQKTGLTGSSGAGPIWSRMMTAILAKYPKTDFQWPQGLETFTVKPDDLKTFPNLKEEPPAELQRIKAKSE